MGLVSPQDCVFSFCLSLSTIFIDWRFYSMQLRESLKLSLTCQCFWTTSSQLSHSLQFPNFCVLEIPPNSRLHRLTRPLPRSKYSYWLLMPPLFFAQYQSFELLGQGRKQHFLLVRDIWGSICLLFTNFSNYLSLKMLIYEVISRRTHTL